MKIYFLGTNGWYDSETGETPCVLIDSKEAYILFDAGNGIRKVDNIITDDKKPIYLFLSHFHLDHINGLHMLIKFSFFQPIKIFGQPGTKRVLDVFLNKPFTVPLDVLNKKIQVEVNELAEGEHNIGIRVECRKLIHADPCFGYRVSCEHKIVTYCTDTGTCDNIAELGKDADLLIAECTWKKRNQTPGWPHLAPEDAAELAVRANAKKLALVHFDAVNYKTKEERKEAEKKASRIFKNTRAMFDGDVLEI